MELGERKLRGGPSLPRERIEANQRERLYGAMVAVVGEKGYAATTISDLMEVACLSRSTFYLYFDDKEDCFLATLEPILAGIIAATRAQLEGEAPLAERAEAGLRAFVDLLVTQPAAARLCVVEAEVVGPQAIAMVDGAAAQFTEMLASVFEQLPEQRGMPGQIIVAMVGGVRKMLQTRLHRGTESGLADLVPELVELGLSYRPPPGPLPDRAPRSRAARTVERYRGIDEPAQRLELAAMSVIARDGYVEARMAEIATEARVSSATLYANFADKEDLFEAAMLRGRLRMAAAVTPAFRRGDSWPAGIAALVRASLAFLEAEEDFAKLITVDVHGAGAAALETRDRALATTRGFITAGIGPGGKADPVAAEAIQSTLYQMLASRLRSRHRNLQGMAPLAIYLILMPFIGAEEAYAWATNGRRRTTGPAAQPAARAASSRPR
jgi:AcrR family transcriptional regulator